ncbi:hypothetical protein CR513_16652, partial [Mucuna pruriens]
MDTTHGWVIKFKGRQSKHHLGRTRQPSLVRSPIGRTRPRIRSNKIFDASEVKHIPRKDNAHANMLSKLATSKASHH